MKYSECIEGGATEAQRQDFLAMGKPTPVTLRMPENLKNAAAETARLRGMSFSAFVRTHIIDELAGEQEQ